MLWSKIKLYYKDKNKKFQQKGKIFYANIIWGRLVSALSRVVCLWRGLQDLMWVWGYVLSLAYADKTEMIDA